MRPLFFILLFANIGFFAWQYQVRGGIADQKSVIDDFQAADPGVAPLVLLSERGDTSPDQPASGAETLPLSLSQTEDNRAALEPAENLMQAESVEAEQMIGTASVDKGGSGDAPVPGDESAAPVLVRYCFELGPSTDRAVMERLQAEMRRTGGSADLRESTQSVRDGYWVRLPEYLSYAEARARYRELQKKGVDDIAIVPLADKRYFISLGVYKRKDTVDDRRKEVLAAGITPAIEDRMITRTDYLLAVEYEAPDPAQPRELWAGFAAQAPKIPSRETECR